LRIELAAGEHDREPPLRLFDDIGQLGIRSAEYHAAPVTPPPLADVTRERHQQRIGFAWAAFAGVKNLVGEAGQERLL